jgi:hypothetical protein
MLNSMSLVIPSNLLDRGLAAGGSEHAPPPEQAPEGLVRLRVER